MSLGRIEPNAHFVIVHLVNPSNAKHYDHLILIYDCVFLLLLHNIAEWRSSGGSRISHGEAMDLIGGAWTPEAVIF